MFMGIYFRIFNSTYIYSSQARLSGVNGTQSLSQFGNVACINPFVGAMPGPRHSGSVIIALCLENIVAILFK